MRRHYLDNLRLSTVLLVLVYHVCYLFNGVGILGAVPGAPNLLAGDVFAAAVYPWFMALLFLVAGMSSRFALEKRTPGEFLRERTVKLLVPSTLGLFVVHWFTGYLNIKMGGGLDSIPAFLLYPIAAVSGTGPLWFIQMLYFFSLVLLLLRKLDKNDRLWALCGKCPTWAAVALPGFLLWAAAQVGNLPVLTMYRFGIYLAAFLLGYFLFSHDMVIDSLTKYRVWLLALTAVLGGWYLARFAGTDYTADPCLRSLCANLYAFGMILTLLALFRTRFDGCGRFLTDPDGSGRFLKGPSGGFRRVWAFLHRNEFGIYVLHYPVFLTIAYLLTTYFSLPAAANYLLTLLSGTLLTFLLADLFRRLPILRFLVLGKRKTTQKKLPDR